MLGEVIEVLRDTIPQINRVLIYICNKQPISYVHGHCFEWPVSRWQANGTSLSRKTQVIDRAFFMACSQHTARATFSTLRSSLLWLKRHTANCCVSGLYYCLAVVYWDTPLLAMLVVVYASIHHWKQLYNPYLYHLEQKTNPGRQDHMKEHYDATGTSRNTKLGHLR